jgi:hypothetical protein
LPCAACTDATEEEIAWSASAWWPSRWNAKIALLSSGRMAEEDGEPGVGLRGAIFANLRRPALSR